MADYLTHHKLSALKGIRHGFFTRKGGVSNDIYASLNCGVGSKDDQRLVRENRARATSALGVAPDRLATPYQVHGIDAIVVETAWGAGNRPRADAVVTNRPSVAVGVGTADCGPIILADGRAGVVGSAHAGWRGALAGIVEAAIAAMERLGARREHIVAVLGPTISQANYEVGAEVVERFALADADNVRFFAPSGRPGHAMFDLPAYILARLLAAGVEAASIDLCTYADAERFYSYRRATHRGEADYGRLLSAIVIAED